MCQDLYQETNFQIQESIVMKNQTLPKSIRFKKERDMQEFLCENHEIISEAINDKIKIIGTEIPVGEYRCDIVAESETHCYPIELKIRQANHQSVSQCLKYCTFFYRKKRYNLFKNIQGIIVANGFDSWSINELRRNNIICLDIHDTEIFKLYKI